MPYLAHWGVKTGIARDISEIVGVWRGITHFSAPYRVYVVEGVGLRVPGRSTWFFVLLVLLFLFRFSFTLNATIFLIKS